MSIWNTLEPAWQTCLTNAWRGSFGIGPAAVVTDGEGRILAAGTGHDLRDGSVQILDKSGRPAAEHVLAHAELTALLRLDYDSEAVRRRECVLYAAVEPCPWCIGALVMSNAVSQLRFAARDPWAGSVSLFATTPYLRRQRDALTIRGPKENPELEMALVALTIAGWLSGNGREFLIEASSEMLPQAARIARTLHEADSMTKWRQSKAAIAEVLNSVHALVASSRQ